MGGEVTDQTGGEVTVEVTPAGAGQDPGSFIAGLIGEMTLEEKVLLLGGDDFWHTNAIERLGIPALHLSDGPSGVRGARSVGTTSVSFPCGIAIGATFDTAAAAQLGSALADECADRGVHVLLGPTVNLHRHPLGGRHFEAYSEDPLLSARLAVAYVRALQEKGVSATVKHYVANDTEYQRHTISSDASEVVLRELYHVPFEAAVHDAGAWAIMSAYNKINGTYAAENEVLLQGTLRDEWGFDGVVVSDWFGTQSTAPSAQAGLDLEMPGPPVHYGKRLAEAVEAGEIDEAVINEHVRRLLVLATRTGALTGNPGKAGSAGSAAAAPATVRTTVTERQANTRRLASSSFVLLRNDGPLLPFDLPPGSTLAVIGPNAANTATQGGGSARVNPVGRSSILSALEERLTPLGVNVVFERGCVTWVTTPTLEADLTLEYYAGPAFDSDLFDGVVHHVDRSGIGSLTWLGEPAADVAELHANGWLLRAKATLLPEDAGLWVFSLVQVGRARLLIDGETVVDAMGELGSGKGFFGFGTEEVSGTIELEAGHPYDLVVEYSPTPALALSGLLIGAVPPVGTDDELLRRAEALAASADAVLCVVGTSPEWETEGHDRPSIELPGRQDELIRHVATANPKTCVLVNAGSPVSMDWEAAAIGQIWFPGEQAGAAVADVILGDTDPGGRLPTTIPIRLEDTPAWPYYPGEDGHAPYGERLMIGYRHYDSRFVEPRYCFGHGLSYTTFELADLELSEPREFSGALLHPGLDGDPIVTVSLTVTNTGLRAGVEVVQCYVHDTGTAVGSEPEQQLRGFEKVALGRGESARITIALPARAFARYDEGRRGFVATGGRFEIRLGRSSRDLPLRRLIDLATEG